jgi:group I intron endonuclease
MSHAGIYLIQCIAEGPDRDRCYVGSSLYLNKRLAHHKCRLRKRKHHAPELQVAWDLYGEEAFAFAVLELVDEAPRMRQRLLEREQFWIDHHGAEAFGYNTLPTAGSATGRKRSAETRARLSAASRGRVVSEETKRRIAVSVGKVMASQTARDKIAAALTGYKHTQEARANMSAALARRMQTPEAKAFISAVNKGRKKPEGFGAKVAERNRSRVWSPEARAAISAAKKGIPTPAATIEKRRQTRARNGAAKGRPVQLSLIL